MKKIRYISVLVVIILLCTPAAYASDSGKGGIYPSKEMDALFESLPDEVYAELSDFAEAENDSDRIKSVVDKFDIVYFIKYVVRIVTGLLLPGISSCAPLLCIILVSALIRKYTSDGSCAEIGNYTTSVIVGVTVCTVTVNAVNIAVTYISRINAVMIAMVPVMNAVLLTSGELTSASVSSAGLMLYITVTEKLTEIVLVPLSGILLALCSVTGVFRSINISSLISDIRRVVMTLMGFSLLIYSFVMGIQSSLAKSADSLSMKTARFAIGTYIPIVGGALSDALTTISAGLSVIKHFTGSIGIVIILLTVLPTVISLYISRLSLIIIHIKDRTCSSCSLPLRDSPGI